MLPAIALANQSRFMHFFDTNKDSVVTQTEFNSAATKRFDLMDHNNNDLVTVDEFRDYMKNRRSESRSMRFGTMDADKNDTISKSEYLDYQRQRAERRFARIDKDGDGILSQQEYSTSKRKRHGRFGLKKQGNFLFNKLDLDKNGVITREESLKAWTDWFNRIDANKDLIVTADEVKVYRSNKWNRK